MRSRKNSIDPHHIVRDVTEDLFNEGLLGYAKWLSMPKNREWAQGVAKRALGGGVAVPASAPKKRRATVKGVNRALSELGFTSDELEFVRGPIYFYISGDIGVRLFSGAIDESGTRVSDLSVKDWVKTILSHVVYDQNFAYSLTEAQQAKVKRAMGYDEMKEPEYQPPTAQSKRGVTVTFRRYKEYPGTGVFVIEGGSRPAVRGKTLDWNVYIEKTPRRMDAKTLAGKLLPYSRLYREAGGQAPMGAYQDVIDAVAALIVDISVNGLPEAPNA